MARRVPHGARRNIDPRPSWPTYRTVRELIHAHCGRAAVVMGGGPTITAALQCPADAVYISANDHGARYFESLGDAAGRVVSYQVACDQIETRLRKYPAPVISRHVWADYRILVSVAPNSGMTAAWLARLLGCSPIILVGMDCYDGATYFDNPAARSTGRQLGVRPHTTRWDQVAVRHPAMYRVAGGHALVARSLGRYDPAEPSLPPVPRPLLEDACAGRWVELRADCAIERRPFAERSVIEVSARDFEILNRHRLARPAAPPADAVP